jgi:hypothetical protein
MKTACPYSFPHKSRAAIAEYLDRDGRYYRPTRYRFCWDVKAYCTDFDSDTMRRHNPDLSPAFDERWQEWIERNRDAFWWFCEDAGRHISEGEWCSYPGDDQGDWQFAFAGRSGGWVVLEKWRGRDVADATKADFLDHDEWPWPDLVAFYRGIRCADQDFTTQKAAAEVEYKAAFHREYLEEEWRAEAEQQAEDMAAAIAADRPDLAAFAA